jgi:hypothetical protein
MMSSESDARRIGAGPLPSQLLGAKDGATPDSEPQQPSDAPPFDPLRLCIFATIALLGWLAGPIALAVFSAVGFVGYWKARRAGLKTSKCFLRDTRLVLAYLGILIGAGLWGSYELAARLTGL